MKAILVIETDAEHIEDLYVEHIWNDCYPVDLGKKVHFKPMPEKLQFQEPFNDDYTVSWASRLGFVDGWNACLEEIEK